MTVASKTELLQMRFVSKGQPFCNITAKTSIDAAGTMDFYRQGDAFSGVSNEITPPVYTYTINSVRQGNAFKWLNAKSTIDSNYGRVTQGLPFYIQSATHTYPVYATHPVRQGNAFKWLNAKSSIDSNYGRMTLGQAFYIQSATHTYPVYAINPVRQGNAFKLLTAKSTIDASSDFYQQGQPFYIYYGGPPPTITFDPTRMFLIF